MAGRTRSFIAASTIRKFLPCPRLRYSTRERRTPALATIERPGSRSTFSPSCLSAGASAAP
jgi:hypothetical protein